MPAHAASAPSVPHDKQAPKWWPLTLDRQPLKCRRKPGRTRFSCMPNCVQLRCTGKSSSAKAKGMMNMRMCEFLGLEQ